jgi:hypothetical protein
VPGEAVAALGGADDRAALLDDRGRRGHALDRLVEVLVERVAGVARDHDVEGLGHRAHGRGARRGARGRVHGPQLARERRDDALLAVEDHVEREVGRARGGDRTDVVVHRVALDAPPRRRGMADASGVVEHEHRVEPREPGRHHLGAAAEAGEEVRLDEAGGDPHVGLHPLAVEPHGHALAVLAEVLQAPRVARVVVDDPHAVRHLGAEHRPDLLVGVAAVGARGHEHGHVVERDHALELLEHGGDHEVARLGARAVAHGDGHAPAAAGGVAQSRPGHGGVERLAQDRPGLRRGGMVRRLDHRGAPVGQVHVEPAPAVGEPHPHRGATLPHPRRPPAPAPGGATPGGRRAMRTRGRGG